MNRAELKTNAKQQIKGKIGILFVIALIIAVISGIASFILSFIPVVGPLASAIIVTPAFALSLVRVYLNITAGIKPTATDAFCGFDDFWSAFKVNFLTGLCQKSFVSVAQKRYKICILLIWQCLQTLGDYQDSV